MNILEMKGIEKSFSGVKVLKDINFTVEAGEVHAVCGENGAGKSTLMKILCGIYEKDQGTVLFKGKEILPSASVVDIQKMGISMIFQELNLLDELTVAQNIFLMREKTNFGFIDEKHMVAMTNEILKELEPIDPMAKVRDLGIAQKQIIEIAKAISYNADLIIMDEPTAVLTVKEVDMLFSLIRKLKSRGVSIIYISHRLPEIVEICDRITVLRDGMLVETCHKGELCQRSLANKMVGRELEPPHVEPFVDEGKCEAIRVQGLTVGDLVKDVNFTIHQGEILGLYGLVGAGRSEMVEGIFGIRHQTKGDIFINGIKVTIRTPREAIKNKLAFVTEDRRGSGLFIYRNIVENMTTVSNIVQKSILLDRKRENEITKKMKAIFQIKYESEDMQVVHLSGGNQQKIVFGKWVAGDAEIFFFDEPTRGVDVGARKEIYNHIIEMSKQGKAIMIISSDLTEILETSQRIMVMHQGRITGEMSHDEATEEKIIFYATGIESGGD